MSIRDIVKTITMAITEPDQEGEMYTSRRVLEHDSLKAFAKAATLVDTHVYPGVTQNERTGHSFMAIRVCNSEPFAFRVWLDEKAAFGLTALFAKHAVKAGTPEQTQAFTKLWMDAAAVVGTIHKQQNRRGMAKTPCPPVFNNEALLKYCTDVLHY